MERDVLADVLQGDNAETLAEELLVLHGGLFNLKWVDPDAYEALGCTPTQAENLKRAFAFHICLRQAKQGQGRAIHKPQDALSWFLPLLVDQPQERFVVLFLDANNAPMKVELISQGSSRYTVVPVDAIFRRALELRARSLILAHNHPSGNVAPSEEDKELTKKINMVGKCLGVTVEDHIVVYDDLRWTSLREQGFLPC